MYQFSEYKLGIEFLSESPLKSLYNESWTYDQIFCRNCSVFNEKTPATVPLTSPLKVQQDYIKNNINNDGINKKNKNKDKIINFILNKLHVQSLLPFQRLHIYELYLPATLVQILSLRILLLCFLYFLEISLWPTQ